MDEKKCRYCAMMIPKEAKICPHCRKKQGWTLPAKIAAGFFILMAIGSIMNAGKNSSLTTSSGPSQSLSPKDEALSATKLEFVLERTGLNVVEANFTIDNQSKYNIKDLEIKCTHFAKSGTAIDSNTRTIYDIVKAHGKKRIERFNMGFIHTQAQSSSCVIADLKLN
jgi:hypothetical protein